MPRSMARWPDMTIMHDAPSVICEDVPAVTVPPFGLKAGLRAARLSRVVSGRMVSSKSYIFRKPFSSYPCIGMISSLKLPSPVACCARRCERTPKASCASRVMPCILASISAVRPIMPEALAAYSDMCGLGSTPCIMPTWPMCSTPPMTNTSPLLLMIAWAAVCNALMDEPHRRLTVCAAEVCGIWVISDAMRAMFQPCSRVWLTQPQITSSTSAGSTLLLRSSNLLIRCADMSSARVLRCMPPLERPIGVRPKSTITTSLGFKLIKFHSRSSVGRLTEEPLASLGHFTQLRGRVVQRAQISVLVSQGNELGDTDRIDVAQRAATEWRETNTVDQTHVGFGGGFNDAVFQAAHGFQAQRDHHPVDDVFVGDFALLVNDRLEHFEHRRIGNFLLLAFLVGLVGIEALAVLLAQALGFVQHVDGRTTVILHAVRKALGHDVTTVMTGVDADHVHQVGRAHRPAEFFHDLVDAHEVHTGADQLGETAEVREQHAIDQEARAVVDDDRVLAHFLGVGNGGGNGQFAGLLATDHFNQRHHVHRVEEVHADEVFRTLEGLGQQGDGNGRGVGREDGVLFDLVFDFSQYRLLDL